MKTKLCIELKDQDEINSLTEIVSYYKNINPVPFTWADSLASDLLSELEKFKKDI